MDESINNAFIAENENNIEKVEGVTKENLEDALNDEVKIDKVQETESDNKSTDVINELLSIDLEKIGAEKEGTNKKKTLRIAIFVGIIIAVVVSVSLMIFVFFSHNKSGSSTVIKKVELNDSVMGKNDGDGTTYIPTMDSNVVKINNDIKLSGISPNRKIVVAMTEDGVLYWRNISDGEKNIISNQAAGIPVFYDEGIIYKDSDENFHRFIFSDSSDIRLGEIEDYEVSDEKLNIVYSTESAVYLLTAGSDEREKIGNVSEKVEIEFVSKDANFIIWDDYKSNEETIYKYVDGEKSRVGVFETSSSYTSTVVLVDKDQMNAVVENYNSETLFLVNRNNEPVKVKLGNELNSTVIYTNNGFFSDSTSFDGIYVMVDNEEYKNVYYVDSFGEREKLLSNVYDCMIFDGYIFYIDNDKNFLEAKLKDATLSEEKKITGDVDFFSSNSDDGYIYYMKEVSEKEENGILYVYKRGNDPIKISSMASYWGLYSYNYVNGACIGENSKTIYYYEESKDIANTYSEYGDLYRYTYGDSASEKIASDVVIYSLSSGFVSGRIAQDSFIYMKYMSVNKDDKVVGDWYYYNGTDSIAMCRDVIK